MDQTNLGIIGVGTAGKRIVEKVSFSLSDALCLSLDDSEWRTLGGRVKEIVLPIGLDKSPGKVKREAWICSKEVASLFRGMNTAVVISGLGGAVGSEATPIVAQRLREEGIKVFGVAIMPFKFEKSRHFKAAVGLKKMKIVCDGVIILDNESFIEKAPQTPLLKAYEMENDWISKFVSTLLKPDSRFGLERGDLYSFASLNKNNIVAVGYAEGSAMAEEAATKIVSSLRKQTGANVSSALVCVVGWNEISVGDVSTIVSVFRGTTLCEGDVRTGYYSNGQRNLTVYAVASVEKTKFDEWDPLSSILGGKELDFDIFCDMKLDGLDCVKLCKVD
ncbi:MAG: hypothetical protein QXJ17_04710 [Nitrososphaeria archaeon]